MCKAILVLQRGIYFEGCYNQPVRIFPSEPSRIMKFDIELPVEGGVVMFKCNQTILSLMIKYLVLVVALLLILLVLRRLLLTPRISSNAGARHVIVISVDALNKDDYEQIKNLPNFRAIMDNGLYAREVTGVNPSLTYPAHTTMITGVEPIKHGIIANTLLQPGVADPDWYWFYKDIKAPTLWDAARQSNLRVGALFWPVSAGAGIDYNIPEIWPNKPNQNQIWLVHKTAARDLFWMFIGATANC
jgi:predicted AlkP superfamily pyrophosphatase or phosphodiesterase